MNSVRKPYDQYRIRTADCTPIYFMQTGFAVCVMIRTKGINLALTDRGTI